MGPIGAVVLGIAGGLGCFLATQFIKRKLEIDDSLDVFPVHAVGGMIGLLLTAIFSASSLGGIGLDEGVSPVGQLGVQVVGIVATFAWCAAVSWGLLKAINAIVALRVTVEEEIEGLDLTLHEESGYNI